MAIWVELTVLREESRQTCGNESDRVDRLSTVCDEGRTTFDSHVG